MKEEKIISLMKKLFKNQQRIGQIFQNIRDTSEDLNKETNSSIENMLEIMLSRSIKKSSECSFGLSEIYFFENFDRLLKRGIPCSRIINSHSNEDFFYKNTEEMLRFINECELNYVIFFKNTSSSLLSLLHSVGKEYSFFVNTLSMLFDLGLKYNEVRNIEYLEFFKSRSYFLEKDIVKNLDIEDIVLIAEKIVSDILSEKKIHTLDLYKIKYFIINNKEKIEKTYGLYE